MILRTFLFILYNTLFLFLTIHRTNFTVHSVQKKEPEGFTSSRNATIKLSGIELPVTTIANERNVWGHVGKRVISNRGNSHTDGFTELVKGQLSNL